MEKHCFCCFFALPSIRQKGPVDLFWLREQRAKVRVPMITDTG